MAGGGAILPHPGKIQGPKWASEACETTPKFQEKKLADLIVVCRNGKST